MKTIKFKCKEYGETFYLAFELSNYVSNNALYVGIYNLVKEYNELDLFSDLSVNLDYDFKENEIAVDVDNPEELIDLLVDMGIITFTGDVAYSGYNTYKIATFNKDKAKDYIITNE